MIRVVIADDHTILREGLKQLLLAAGDLAVVGEAGDGHAALEQVRVSDCDVLILDMSMPGRSGTELIRQIKEQKPRVRILVLSMHAENQYAVRALKAGASGYLTKDSAGTQLVSAIRKVAAGGAFISAEVAEQLALGASRQAEGPLHSTLSDREYQVFRMLAAGTSVSEIAGRLNLSSKTVSTHKARLMEKLHASNQADLIHYAMKHGLLDDPNHPS